MDKANSRLFLEGIRRFTIAFGCVLSTGKLPTSRIPEFGLLIDTTQKQQDFLALRQTTVLKTLVCTLHRPGACGSILSGSVRESALGLLRQAIEFPAALALAVPLGRVKRPGQKAQRLLHQGRQPWHQSKSVRLEAILYGGRQGNHE